MTCHVIAVTKSSTGNENLAYVTGRPDVFSFLSPAPLPNAHAHEEIRLACETRYVYMVATIVLVVSNKPIQSSMNNTSSDSKVTMRVDGTFHG